MGSLLLMAPQLRRRIGRASPTVARMIELFDEVTARGHRMCYLGPTAGSACPKGLHAVVDAVEHARAGAVLRVQVDDAIDEYCIHWPKDVVQGFRSFLAVARCPVGRRIAARLGARSVRESSLAEGGLMIRAGRELLVSSAGKRHLDLDLVSKDYRVHVLPHPFTSKAYRAEHEPSPFGKTHIDLDCSVVGSESGAPLLLVGELYHRVYGRRVRAVASALRATIHVVPREEVERRALNLLWLPPADVVVAAGCPSTRAALEDHLGREHVVCVRLDRAFRYHQGAGGLGCMSSVIDLRLLGARAQTSRRSAGSTGS